MKTIKPVPAFYFAVAVSRIKEGLGQVLLMKNVATLGAIGLMLLAGSRLAHAQQDLDSTLTAALNQAGFTGIIEATLEVRLGRRIDKKLANLGRLLWFDNAGGLHSDNTCGGCHSPTNGFGDTQSIAIGIQNNGIVGPNRSGPRNQRRSPSMANTAFYPNLMWNGRFSSASGDAFDNSGGFQFPLPEGITMFRPSARVTPADRASSHPSDRAGRSGWFPGRLERSLRVRPV
jgi:cytochrome c peroxidase